MKRDISKVKKVNFDTCTVCNHLCHFCANNDARAVKNILPAHNFRKVMGKICAVADIQELGLSGKGEPLLNPQLEQIIDIAKNEFRIPYVYISSNGSLMDLHTLRRLLDAGLDSVKISINAFTREEYEKIHGKDHFRRVMINVADVLRERGQRPFRILTSSVTTLGQDEVREKLRVELGDLVDAIDYMLIYHQDYMPHFEDPGPLTRRYKPCPCLMHELYVDANCEVLPCCVDFFGEARFGNLKEIGLEEAYNGEAMCELRHQHVEGSVPEGHLCYRCFAFKDDVAENRKHADVVLKTNTGRAKPLTKV